MDFLDARIELKTRWRCALGDTVVDIAAIRANLDVIPVVYAGIREQDR